MNLAKYNIDIAVLSETRFHASGSLNDLDYTLYWSGKPTGERRGAGVGFAIKKGIVAKLTEMPHPMSNRIMTMRIPLTKNRNATIVSAYAPTMSNPEKNKETFYSQLKRTLRNIPSTDKLLLIGDFNARIGRENYKWPSALGKYGIGKCNSNEELLLALCTEFDLIVTNTMFKQKDEYHLEASPLSTRAYDRLHHHQMPDKMDICTTRTMRGANCGTDHQMLRSRVIFSFKEKTQSERSYETRKAEHKQTEKHQPPRAWCRKWTMHSPTHWKILKPLAGLVSNRLCTIPLKHLSANRTRNIKTSLTQMTRYYVI